VAPADSVVPSGCATARKWTSLYILVGRSLEFPYVLAKSDPDMPRKNRLAYAVHNFGSPTGNLHNCLRVLDFSSVAITNHLDHQSRCVRSATPSDYDFTAALPLGVIESQPLV